MPAITFKNAIPDWYEIDGYYAVTPEQAPNFTPPANLIFGSRPLNGRRTQEDMFTKGWTHVSHSSYSTGTSPANSRKYYDAVRSADIFSTVPHYIESGDAPLGQRRIYTEAAVRARANEFAPLPIFVGETAEASDWDPQPIYMYYFLDQMKINALAAGYTNFKSTRNYFWGWRPDIQLDNPWAHASMSGLDALRVLFQYPASEWNTRYPDYYDRISSFYKNGSSNLSLEGWYAKPNNAGTVKVYMEYIHRLILAKKFISSISSTGTSGVYLRAGYEVTGFDTYDDTEIGGGHLVSKSNMPLSMNEIVAIMFTSFWFGKTRPVAFHWHNAPYDNVDKTKRYPDAWIGNRHYFIKNDLTEQGPVEGDPKIVAGFPYYNTNYNLSSGGPLPYFDHPYFGFLLYCSCQDTIGGTEKWASYRLDGGDWTVLTADNAEPINCAQQNRGIAVTRKLGSWVTVWYWNPAGKNEKQDIEIKDPDSSTVWTGEVFGNKIHLAHFTV